MQHIRIGNRVNWRWSQGHDCNITWTSKNFKPKIHPFFSRNSGMKKKICRSSQIIYYFELFIFQELVLYIANETNYCRVQKNNNLDTQENTTVDCTVFSLCHYWWYVTKNYQYKSTGLQINIYEAVFLAK